MESTGTGPGATAPPARRVTGGRRLAFAAVLAAVVAAATEGSAFLLLWATDGALPRPAAWLAERNRAAAADDGRAGVAAAGDAALVGRHPRWAHEVLHPFLGYVHDPAQASPLPLRRVSGEGFSVPADAPAEPPANRFTVLLLGGSVAEDLAIRGREALAAELSRLPRVAGRPIWVESYSLGGYKQPQQIAVSTWLLAQGHPVDLVVNLDGFNEVVLPAAENLRAGVNPYYPRGWEGRVRHVAGTDELRRLGEIAFVREVRVRRTGLCGGALLRWSPTCHLVWRSLDRRLAARLGALQAEGEQRAAGGGFLTSGPAFERFDEVATYRELAAYWARCSRLLADLYGSRDVPYFHFLQPNQYVRGSRPFSAAERRLAFNRNHVYRRHVEAGYPHLIAAGQRLRQDGVAFHDLTQVFADVEEVLYADTCCHLNDEGNRRLGAEIGRRVVAELAPQVAGRGAPP